MESYVWLGNVVGTYQGHPQEARQWYDKMVQRNPKNWQAQLERGIYLASIAAGEEALSAALKTLELQPDESGALLLASRCYLAKRDFATSRRYAARGVELYPDLAGMYINMAEVEGAAKHADKAIAVVRQGLATTGENPQLCGPWPIGSSTPTSWRKQKRRSTSCGSVTTNRPKQKTIATSRWSSTSTRG